MGKVYENQPLDLSLTSDIDLSGADSVVIDYIDNKGVTGRWAAELTLDDKTVKYTIPADILKHGRWKTYIVAISGTAETPSTVFSFDVYKRGQ